MDRDDLHIPPDGDRPRTAHELRRAAENCVVGVEDLRLFYDMVMSTNRPPTYTIQAGLNGGYAWVRFAGDKQPGIGQLCARVIDGAKRTWNGVHSISAALDADLARWQQSYERPIQLGATPAEVMTTRFQAHGFALGMRLKAELGDSVAVRYRQAGLDPAKVGPSGSTTEIFLGHFTFAELTRSVSGN